MTSCTQVALLCRGYDDASELAACRRTRGAPSQVASRIRLGRIARYAIPSRAAFAPSKNLARYSYDAHNNSRLVCQYPRPSAHKPPRESGPLQFSLYLGAHSAHYRIALCSVVRWRQRLPILKVCSAIDFNSATSVSHRRHV